MSAPTCPVDLAGSVSSTAEELAREVVGAAAATGRVAVSLFQTPHSRASLRRCVCAQSGAELAATEAAVR